MKRFNKNTRTIFYIGIFLLCIGCGSKSGQEGAETSDGEGTQLSNDTLTEAGENDGSTAPGPRTGEVAAISMWEDISVRETAGSKGKWLTSLSIGETVTYLNETQTVDKKDYTKIRLRDGKEGWSYAPYIAPEAKAAVFKHDTEIYKRPDLLTKSGKKFRKMDIVALKPATQDGWAPVEGKRSEGKWIEKGWVKVSNLSEETVDIAVAKFAKKALQSQDIKEKVSILNDLIDNADFNGSVFIPELREVLTGLQNPSPEAASYEEEGYEEPAPAEDAAEATDSIR